MRASVKFRGNLSFITDPIPKEKERIGNRQGALIRTIARRAIRSRKRRSRPGESPTNQTGKLKKQIFYQWDSATQSVAIKPRVFSQSKNVPGALEFGLGAELAARPYMRPSLDAAMARLPELWNGAIK